MSDIHAEEWRTVSGLEDYQVSSRGHVRRSPDSHRDPGRILKAGRTIEGYARIQLGRTGQRRNYLVHVLTAAAFIGPKPPGEEVRHLDGDATNGLLGNLAYGTPTTNALDAVEHGTHTQARKERCPEGHEYEQRTGRRRCLPCARVHTARYRAKRKG